MASTGAMLLPHPLATARAILELAQKGLLTKYIVASLLRHLRLRRCAPVSRPGWRDPRGFGDV